MPGERVSMRNIREVLRLRLGQGLPQRAIARSLGLSLGAVNGYVGRARRAGLCWPLPDGLDDGRLEALLYPPPTVGPAGRRTGPGRGPGAPRDAAPRRDLGAGVGGVQGRRSGRLRLLLVLRPVSGVGGTPETHLAAGA